MKYSVERNDQLVGIVSESMLVESSTENTETFDEIVGAINYLNAEAAAESVNTTNGFKVSRHSS